jgi:hypothetical protein
MDHPEPSKPEMSISGDAEKLPVGSSVEADALSESKSDRVEKSSEKVELDVRI